MLMAFDQATFEYLSSRGLLGNSGEQLFMVKPLRTDLAGPFAVGRWQRPCHWRYLERRRLEFWSHSRVCLERNFLDPARHGY